MTPAESRQLGSLEDWLREWREEDKTWKTDVGERLRTLEDDRIKRDAVAQERSAEASTSTIGIRWQVGILVSLIVAIPAAINAFVNLVHTFLSK